MDVLNEMEHTPLEEALNTCQNIDILNILELSRLYLHAGVAVTDRMKQFVIEIGKQFEFHRANFNEEHVEEFSSALDDLYRLFGVKPVARRLIHDGKMAIAVMAKDWRKQHQELWELLVPSSGHAETIQGEVIRIGGRIARELDGNGGINWDADYKRMADAFLSFVKQGEALSASELNEAEELVKEIKKKEGDTSRMCELGVKWVISNPSPMPLHEVTYTR